MANDNLDIQSPKSSNLSDSEVYHYTGADGLVGIIKEGQIRATHSGFLNDREERTGFFDRRLPALVKPMVKDIVKELIAAGKLESDGRDSLDEVDGLIAEFSADFREKALRSREMYVLSFCTPPKNDKDHGLLSQWRGYGKGGGYAIVFDTQKLQKAMQKELVTHYYSLFGFARVCYFAPDGTGESTGHVLVHENKIKSSLREYFLAMGEEEGATERAEVLHDAVYESFHVLSCLHKHRGFEEEAEVRLYASPISESLYARFLSAGPQKSTRPTIEFRSKNGLLVPYINLQFGTDVIKRVIVGPSVDATRRMKSVQMLLRQHGCSAEVVNSTIPFIE